MTGFSTVSTNPYNIVTAIYKVTTAFAGAALGDILQSVEVYDQIANPATPIDTVWNNLTQQTNLGAVTPLAANITPIDSVASTADLSATQLYTCKVAFGISAVNDVLENVQVYNPAVIPPALVSSAWYNLTQQAVEPTAPTAADITPGVTQTSDTSASALYTAVAANAGQYAIGDVLQQVHIINPATGLVTATIYNNLTTGVNGVTVALPTDIVPGTTQTVDTSAAALYTAVAASAGNYAIGDVLQQVHIINPTTGLVTATIYNNLTTGVNGVTIAAQADIVPGTSSPVNAVTTAIYTAVGSGTGYVQGDVIQQVTVWDTTTVPPTEASVSYNNLTQNTTNITPAPFSDVLPSDVNDGQVVTTALYRAVANSGGNYSIGDVLQRVSTYYTAGSLASNQITLTTDVYNNLTTDTANVTVAVQSDIVPVGSSTGFVDTTALYTAVVANAGQYSIGDIVQQVQVIDPDTIPPTVISTTYNNLTTASNNITIAAQSDIVPVTPAAVTSSSNLANAALTFVDPAGTVNIGDLMQITNLYDVAGTPVGQVIRDLQVGINLQNAHPASFFTPLVNFTSVEALYYVTTAFAAGNIGDVIQQVVFYRPNGNPGATAQVSVTWNNLTQQTANITVVTADIAPISSLTTPTYNTIQNLYTVTTAFAGANLGDVLENLVTYDALTTPPTQTSSVWLNLTLGTTLGAAPLIADIIPGTSQATTTDFNVDTLYTAKVTVGGSYTIGDILQSISVYNPATIPPTLVDTLWLNLTTGLAIVGAVPATDVNVGITQSITADTTYTAQFQVTSAGSAGTTVGDILQRAVSINPVTSAVVATIWNNLTAGTTIAAPSYANLTPLSPALTPTYSTVTSLYYVLTAGTGYAVNDIVQEVKTFSTDAGIPTLITTDWYNLTQGATIGGGVTIGDVKPVGTPGSNSNYGVVSNQYYATNAGTGYSVNDVLSRTDVLNLATSGPVAIVATQWFNETTEAQISAPLTTDVAPGLLTTSAQNYSTIIEQFVAVVAGPDYNVGDILDAVVVLDMNSPAPITAVSTSWINLTQQTEFASVAATSDVIPIGTIASHNAVTTLYSANTTNVPAGYNITDTIAKVEVLDDSVSPPTIISTIWTNATTNTAIAAPTLTELTASQSQLPPALGPQTNANSLSVYVANQSTLSYFPVVTQYLVSTAFAVPAPGAALGDVVQSLDVYDATTSPATLISSSWSNLTTGATYASAPAIGDLTPTFGNGLTNAELRAAPVAVTLPTVSRVSAMTSVGPSTTASTAPGKVSVSFYNNSTTIAATVAGGTLPPSTAISFQANDTDTLAAISYTTAAGGSLLIATLT